ncbi:hypothetical protein [Mangrovicoccus ximenensis]|uniref:hypothetical protein n=1 Tax=Mangrovicoccus ximenensis TaxID=1911570 RepID=UPI001F37E7D0|nr:hypothetical protein [Mangrovicoccus ximenensis]
MQQRRSPNLIPGRKRCLPFGGLRAGTLVTGAVSEAVAPLAIEAALQVCALLGKALEDKRTVLERELQQARHGASQAERRYATGCQDNRLIASERPCCVNAAGDSLRESSMIAGGD